MYTIKGHNLKFLHRSRIIKDTESSRGGLNRMIYSKRVSTEIQKRREDIFYAYYIEGIPVEFLAEYSGYSKRTIGRDLEYIQANMLEFGGYALTEEDLKSAEDNF